MKPFPFEVHLTLSSITPTQEFLEVCKELECKPIILDLDGEQQVTTSSVYKCDLQDIGGHADALANSFKRKGYEVIRKKIETVPWHPIARCYVPKNKVDDCYFESHLTYELRSYAELDDLRKYAALYHMHISRNALKPMRNTIKIMGTIRTYGSCASHNDRVAVTSAYITNSTKLKPIKSVTEFAIMDTNTALDNNWMKK